MVARAVRKSPARAEPADERAWFPVPDVDALPALEDLLEPYRLVAPRATSVDGNVRPTPVRPHTTVYASPARALPAEADAWLPVPNVDSLPALEELLDDDQLVNSGQTQAITVTDPVPVISPPKQRWAPTRERAPKRERAPRRERAPKRQRAPQRPRAPQPDRRRTPKTTLRPAPEQPRQQTRQQTRRHPRRRLLLVALALTTTAAVAFALPQLLPHSPEVTIRIDGRERISAQTDAHTVRSALREHHVKLGSEDRVTPRPSTKITDGLAVDVIRAFPVVVDFDGQVTPVNTTWPKPAQLMRQLTLDPKKISIVTAPTRLTQGASVVLRTLHQVTISVDGTQQSENTAALNVGEFLQQNGVVVNPDDQVSPAAETRLADGMTVTVARISKDTAQADEALPPPTIRQDDPSLAKGQQREVQAGVAGTQRVTYAITKKDGQEVERTPISKVPIQPATPQIIAVGTALPNQRTGSASWYDSPFGGDSCATKEYVPKGTMLRVTNLDTGQSTTCRVADRVEANRVVDMDRRAFAQLAPPSQGTFPASIDW
jgi:uncharacterized protein YabE (DUF348 family)